jgi:hypothetical protein
VAGAPNTAVSPSSGVVGSETAGGAADTPGVAPVAMLGVAPVEITGDGAGVPARSGVGVLSRMCLRVDRGCHVVAAARPLTLLVSV